MRDKIKLFRAPAPVTSTPRPRTSAPSGKDGSQQVRPGRAQARDLQGSQDQVGPRGRSAKLPAIPTGGFLECVTRLSLPPSPWRCRCRRRMGPDTCRDHGARRHHRHGPAPERRHPGRPFAVTTVSGRTRHDRLRRRGHPFPVRPPAEPRSNRRSAARSRASTSAASATPTSTSTRRSRSRSSTTRSCRRTRSSRVSRCSTSTRSKCCAARRARCSAATRRPACIKFESRRPSQERDGYAQVCYGKYGTVNFEGAVGGALRRERGRRASRRSTSTATTGSTTPSPARTTRSRAIDEFAARVQLLYEPATISNALFNVHARSLDGTARLFRANIIEPRHQRARRRFRARTRSRSTATTSRTSTRSAAAARLRWDFGRSTLHSITGYETVDTLSRGDIDGGFGAVFAPPSGPGFIPFTAESADGLPDHAQFTQEFRFESNEWGRFDWQAGVYLLRRRHHDRQLQLRHAGAGRRAERLCAAGAGQRGLGGVRLAASTSVSDELHAARRPALHQRREGLHGRALPVAAVVPRRRPDRADRASTPTTATSAGTLSGTWAASDDTNFYARVARGFRAPSIQGRLLFGDVGFGRRLGRGAVVRGRHQGRPVGSARRASASPSSSTRSTTSSSPRSAARPTSTR